MHFSEVPVPSRPSGHHRRVCAQQSIDASILNPSHVDPKVSGGFELTPLLRII